MDKQELNFEEINIPDFIPVYPKLSNEVYKKIDLRFIKRAQGQARIENKGTPILK